MRAAFASQALSSTSWTLWPVIILREFVALLTVRYDDGAQVDLHKAQARVWQRKRVPKALPIDAYNG